MALKARALCYQASDLFANNPVYADFKNKKGELLFPVAGDPVAQKKNGIVPLWLPTRQLRHVVMPEKC